MKTIKDIMTDECVCVTQQETVIDAAVKMRDNDIGFIPVVDGKKLIGVVTDRDLTIRGYAEQKAGTASVKEVMSNDITSVTSDVSVDEAANLMAQKQIRRLPVVENGDLIAVVSIGDLAVEHAFDDEAGEALSEISKSPAMTVH